MPTRILATRPCHASSAEHGAPYRPRHVVVQPNTLRPTPTKIFGARGRRVTPTSVPAQLYDPRTHVRLSGFQTIPLRLPRYLQGHTNVLNLRTHRRWWRTRLLFKI